MSLLVTFGLLAAIVAAGIYVDHFALGDSPGQWALRVGVAALSGLVGLVVGLTALGAALDRGSE